MKRERQEGLIVSRGLRIAGPPPGISTADEAASVRVIRLARGTRGERSLCPRSICSSRWSSRGGALFARTVPAELSRTRPDRATATPRTPRSPSSRVAITSAERRRRPREEV